MNNYNLSQLKIDILRTQLIGNNYSIMTENKKGKELEKAFNYLIIQPENGGEKIKSLENDKSIFNYTKIPRSFKVDMAGLVSLEETKGDSTDIKTEEISEDNKCIYSCELKQYDFYNEGIVEFNHNEIKIEYDLENMKYKEGKNNLSEDFCDDLKNYAKSLATSKTKNNIYRKVENFIGKEKEKFKEKLKQNKIKEEDYVSYLEKIISFSEFIKTNFNGAQIGYPSIIKFAQIAKEEKNDIFFFHVILRREIDSAIKVLDDYDFIKYSNMEEVQVTTNYQNIFKKNNILLFEIKDTTSESQGLQCINLNYNVMNGFIKALKRKEEFKNCEFYYILIQENKKEKNYNLYADLIKEIQSKIQKDNLYVKFYLFNENNLFNTNIREINPDKLQILSLLKDELLSFKRKFNNFEEKIISFEEKINNIDRKFNIIFIVLIAFLIILFFKKTI
jgi:hypothetical protein